MLRPPGFCKTATGLDDACCKKQHQQAEANGCHCVVDIQHDIPNAAALEVGKPLCEKLPNFRQFFVPCIERRIKVIYDP
jgi:hypothetical protein